MSDVTQSRDDRLVQLSQIPFKVRLGSVAGLLTVTLVILNVILATSTNPLIPNIISILQVIGRCGAGGSRRERRPTRPSAAS